MSSGARIAVFPDVEEVSRLEQDRRAGLWEEPTVLTRIRDEAIAHAKAIVESAERQSKHVRAEARTDGYRAGFTEGYEAARITGFQEAQLVVEELKAALAAIVEQIECEANRIRLEAEPQMVALAIEVAHKVVKEQSIVDRDLVISLIANALRRVVDKERICLHVNLADIPTVSASRDDILAMVDGIDRLEIVEDRRVSPGGCVLETSAGIIDARIETQFAEIEQAMRHVTREAA